jgi:hypothetical protein
MNELAMMGARPTKNLFLQFQGGFADGFAELGQDLTAKTIFTNFTKLLRRDAA